MVALVSEVGQDENRDVAGNLTDLLLHVVPGPGLRNVKHEDGTVTTFVHVDKTGVKASLELLALPRRHLEPGELLPLLGDIHHVPDLDLDDVLGVLVAPVDAGHLDLLSGAVLLYEGLPLQPGQETCLA